MLCLSSDDHHGMLTSRNVLTRKHGPNPQPETLPKYKELHHQRGTYNAIGGSTGVPYDRATRREAPRKHHSGCIPRLDLQCHARTRTAIREQSGSCHGSPRPMSSMLLNSLRVMSSFRCIAGESVIAQSIAEQCEAE